MENNLYSRDFQRLEKVKKFLQLQSYSEFSRKIGMKNPQFFSEIKRGKSGISKKTAEKICNTYPQISFEWLLNGTGEMLNGGIHQEAKIEGNNTGNVNTISTTSDTDRLLALWEAEKDEKRRLLAIIENLTKTNQQ